MQTNHIYNIMRKNIARQSVKLSNFMDFHYSQCTNHQMENVEIAERD